MNVLLLMGTASVPWACSRIQRESFTGSPNTLAADGAWVRGEDGELRFLGLPEPTAEEVAQLASWTHARLVQVLERNGRLSEFPSDRMKVSEKFIRSPGQGGPFARASGATVRVRWAGGP